MQSSSVASRAALALALMVGFYVLAFAVAAGLFSVPYLLWVATHHFNIKLALFCIGGGAIILWSIVPRPDRFTPPGPALSPRTQPALFREIRSVARDTGQEVPAEVYLVPDVNAWVAQRGGIMGFGSRRVMGLGLPLLQLLTVPQLRAVLAHEFGHFYGGDTRLGPWVYKTRAAIGRTLENLAEHSEVLQKPFELYGNLFLRLTHAVSRRQELSADALAARVVGPEPLAQGLRVTHGGGAAFGAYWTQEVAPLLDRGFRPPICEGLERFMTADSVSASLKKLINEEMEGKQHDPFDTHPPLRERIAALGSVESDRDASPDPRAVTLVGDVATLEKALLAGMAGEEAAGSLKTVPWDDVGARVMEPAWGKAVAESSRAFAGVTVAGFPGLASRVVEFARELKRPSGEPRDRETLKAKGAWYLSAGLGHVLARRGWAVESHPGVPLRLRRGAEMVDPFAEIQSLLDGQTTAEMWQSRVAAWGLQDAELSDGSSRTDPER